MPEKTPEKVPDFSGWATKNDLVCSDGRVIKQDAFLKNDKKKVPLVWQHGHTDNENILGHAILENRAFGVYTHGYFNETPKGKAAKIQVQHGDLDSLSIWANNLVQHGANVMGGDIKEVSLVMAGANPGAIIDNLYIRHSNGDLEDNESEAIIFTGLVLEHIDHAGMDSVIVHAEVTATAPSEEEVGEIYETMDTKQKDVLHYLVGKALEHNETVEGIESVVHVDGEAEPAEVVEELSEENGSEDPNALEGAEGESTEGSESENETPPGEDPAKDDELEQNDKNGEHLAHNNQEGSTEMTRNAFEQQDGGTTLAHKKLTIEQIATIVNDGDKKYKSMKESFLAHAEDYGITNIDFLFPDFKTLSTTPELLARRVEWVDVVLSGVKKSPFSRIKSIVADLTAAEARAKGYVTGTEKTEEVISLLKRTTGPTTIYKKQKLDRDDIVDITELDVIAWLKWEMRFMLDEEIARAILLGDGRSIGHADKIKDPAGATSGEGIRSILHDNVMYAHQVELPANVLPQDQIKAIVRARTAYRGSGNPVLFMADSKLTDMLLLEDKIGRRLYDTEASLSSAMRVSRIVSVEVMEEYPAIVGIVVNLSDYTLGADKGGEINFFDDFDIDFNQEKYLIETRGSGGLTKPKSALVITRILGTAATPVSPSFVGGTNTLTIPTTTGVDYLIHDEIVSAGAVVITETTEVTAQPKTGYYFPGGTTTAWTFTYTDLG